MINENNIDSIFEQIDGLIALRVDGAEALKQKIDSLVYDLRVAYVEIERLGAVIENLQVKSLDDEHYQ